MGDTFAKYPITKNLTMTKNNDNLLAFCIALAIYVGAFCYFLLDNRSIITPNTPSEHTISIALSQIQSASKPSTHKDYKQLELNKPIQKPKQETTKEQDSLTHFTQNPQQQTTQSPEQIANSHSQNDEYALKIKNIILKEHKYPPNFSAMGLKGMVAVEFSITTSGNIINEHITQSSGLDTLDKHALKTLKKASRNFPKPQNERIIRTSLNYNIKR